LADDDPMKYIEQALFADRVKTRIVGRITWISDNSTVRIFYDPEEDVYLFDKISR
jgi:hypothetical protein